ncbi:ligand-dependent nuclear receptor-interacting factor 1-like [Eleutherodactylus coqui]|uniref:ligand-dependent nuclear receptor-interacting factor 1-like n=1 Tax=Eleutherodactylus coqui TaxID=57060 RepID=UPI003462F617
MSHHQAAPANHCLTGCLYQVVQTTGLQGSNVLKLLPVLKSKDNPIPAVTSPQTPSSAPTLNVPAAVISSPPPPPVSIIPRRPGPVSVPLVQAPTLGNYIIAARNNLTNTLHIENPFPLSPETTLFLDNRQLTLPTNSVPGNPTLIMMNRKPVSPVKPITMLPPGHSIQIPSHAEVLSVPVSSLPLSIQQKILSQTSSTDSKKLPTVIYVSPVNTIKNNNYNAPPHSTPNTSSVTSGAKSPPQQRPPFSGSEAPKGPMKWVVQQNQESAACLVPMRSSTDTASKILQMLSKTKMEEINLNNSDRSKVVQIKENALVMCEDKIFFLTKKGADLTDTGSKDPQPPQYCSPGKPPAPSEPVKDLASKAVKVVAPKMKPPPPPITEESVQSNVVSTAKPKRKSSTPRAVRDDPNIIYITDDDDCSQVSANPRDVPWPSNPTGASTVNAANKGDAAKKYYQLQPKLEEVEVTAAKTDGSWRLEYGLLKKEKIILRRIPLIQAEDPPSPADPQLHLSKRRSSSSPTVTASKRQKSAEEGGANPANLESTDPPSASTVPREVNPPDPSERSGFTWSPTYYGGEASYPPDIADFQADQDVAGPFTDVSLPSQRFHIDSMYADETTKDEKIQRLKEVLKEREKALEALRRPKT